MRERAFGQRECFFFFVHRSIILCLPTCSFSIIPLVLKPCKHSNRSLLDATTGAAAETGIIDALGSIDLVVFFPFFLFEK